MGAHGEQLGRIGTHGDPWGAMGTDGKPWGRMGTLGGAMGTHGAHGEPWKPWLARSEPDTRARVYTRLGDLDESGSEERVLPLANSRRNVPPNLVYTPFWCMVKCVREQKPNSGVWQKPTLYHTPDILLVGPPASRNITFAVAAGHQKAHSGVW